MVCFSAVLKGLCMITTACFGTYRISMVVRCQLLSHKMNPVFLCNTMNDSMTGYCRTQGRPRNTNWNLYFVYFHNDVVLQSVIISTVIVLGCWQLMFLWRVNNCFSSLWTGYRNALKISHVEVDAETKEQVLLTAYLVDSTRIFQSLIRHENNAVFCSPTATESRGKKAI